MLLERSDNRARDKRSWRVWERKEEEAAVVELTHVVTNFQDRAGTVTKFFFFD
jgi:tRNA(Ile2) C34 agmatinyltransferase TiaS